MVLAAVVPALDSVSDKQLLEWIKLVTTELVNIETRFCVVDGVIVDVQETSVVPTLDLGGTQIQATQWTDD